MPSDPVEVMARAIYAAEHSCQAPENMSPPFAPKSKIGLAVSSAQAALSALDAAGYAVVPKDGTDQGVDACLSAIRGIDPFGRDDHDMTPQQYSRYRIKAGLIAGIQAMLSAAQVQP